MNDQDIRTRVEEAVARSYEMAAEHAAAAGDLLKEGRYSAAATEAHRAHQDKLIGDNLQALIDVVWR